MLKENAQVVMEDLEKKQNVEMEVIFSKEKDVPDKVKVKMGDREAIINKNDLYTFVFAIVEDKQQENLIPSRNVFIKKLKKQHHVKTLKDLKAGEMLVVNCETDIPVEVWNAALNFKGQSQVPEEKK